MFRQVRRLVTTVTVLVAAAFSSPAQTPPPEPTVTFHRDAVGHASLQWDSSLGYEDTLEKSVDTLTWAPVAGPFYGLAQHLSVAVPEADTQTGGSGPPTGPMPKYLDFVFNRYSGNTLTASWQGTAGSVHKALPASWAALDLPILTFHTRPDLTPTHYILIYEAPGVTAGSAPPDSSLNAADAATWDVLNSSYQGIAERLAAGPIENGGTQSSTTSQTGLRGYFRVVRRSKDSDEDRLTDAQELAWGLSSAFDPDSDHDGIPDHREDFDGDGLLNYEEFAIATPPAGGPQNYYGPSYGTVTIGSSVYPTITFRRLPGVAHRYFYQIQQTQTFVPPWTDLNMYDYAVGSPVPASDGSGAEMVTVRSTIPMTQGSTWLRARILESWPPYDLAHQTVTIGNIKAHSDTCIANLVPQNPVSLPDTANPIRSDHGWSSNRRLFDSYDRDAAANWATRTWPCRLDLTGVSWSDYRCGPGQSAAECTLLSPRHVVWSLHYDNHHEVGDTIIFHDAFGNRITRTLIGKSNYGDDDVDIGLLDRDVPPSLKSYKVLPIKNTSGNSISWLPMLYGAQAIVTNRERECVVYNIITSDPASTTVTYGALTPRSRYFRLPPRDFFCGSPTSDTSDQFQGGDSSNPDFIFVRGEQVVISHHWHTGIPGDGPFYGNPSVFTRINALMQQLGGGYQLTTISIE